MSTHFTKPQTRDLSESRLASRKEHLLSEITREHRRLFALPATTRPRLIVLAAAAVAAGGCAFAIVAAGGTSAHPPLGVSHGLPNGGTATGTTPNCGMVTQPAQTSSPPPDFDPATATAAQLQKYGFPPRPAGDSSSPAVKAWLQAVTGATIRDTPEQTCSSDTHGGPPSGNP